MRIEGHMDIAGIESVNTKCSNVDGGRVRVGIMKGLQLPQGQEKRVRAVAGIVQGY